MLENLAEVEPRRGSPRVDAESFCTHFQGDAISHAIVSDLSRDGLRILRPLGGRTERTLRLEFEIPEVDELVWGVAEVCSDRVERANARSSLGGSLIRSTGLRLVRAADRHKRLLREFVMDNWRQTSPVIGPDCLMQLGRYR